MLISSLPGVHRRLRPAAVISAILSLLFCGCRKAETEPAQGSGKSSATMHALPDSGQRVTIETAGRSFEIISGDNGWPAGIPVEVPRLSPPLIRSVTRTESPEGESWTIVAASLDPAAVRAYAARLQANGFQVSSMIAVRGGSITGMKDGTSVALVSSAGSTTISVAVRK